MRRRGSQDEQTEKESLACVGGISEISAKSDMLSWTLIITNRFLLCSEPLFDDWEVAEKKCLELVDLCIQTYL